MTHEIKKKLTDKKKCNNFNFRLVFVCNARCNCQNEFLNAANERTRRVDIPRVSNHVVKLIRRCATCENVSKIGQKKTTRKSHFQLYLDLLI